MGCGSEPIDLTGAPTSGSRHRLPHVEFDIWNDYLSLEMALSDECTFLDPIIDDHSVRNPPIQVFWVVYTNEDDADEGTSIQDSFWLGDRFGTEDYPDRNSLEPLGFSFPSPFQQGLLSIEEIVVSDDRTQVDGILGNPIGAKLRARGTPNGESCDFEVSYCQQPCDEPDRAINHIVLDLGALNTVQDVHFIEP